VWTDGSSDKVRNFVLSMLKLPIVLLRFKID
jgi:hypothetical protein